MKMAFGTADQSFDRRYLVTTNSTASEKFEHSRWG
jgi:hypothetical protein